MDKYLAFQKIHWKLISIIYKQFFSVIYLNEKLTKLYDFEKVFEDELGETKLITRVGNMKRNAKELLPIFNTK